MPFTYLFLKVLKTASAHVIIRLWQHCAKHDSKVLHQLIKRLANFKTGSIIAHSFNSKSLNDAGKSADYNFANYVKDLLYDNMGGLNVQTGPTSEAAQKTV